MGIINHRSILKNGKYNIQIENVDPQILLRLYKFMLRLRKVQEALIQEYHPANEMRCPAHFCIGQEAVPAALHILIQENDILLSHHRSHGYFFAKGGPMRNLFAEMYGKSTGANGGIAGSQDISMPSLNFFGGAILAGMPAIAVGSALGFIVKKVSNIAIAGFGDGTTDEGIFWEAMNYSALKKLPIVFICENNSYSTYSHQLKRQVKDNISQRVKAFGVRSESIFGNDVIKVYLSIRDAILSARNNKGPSFIEAYTYRLNSHVGPEDDDYLQYRPKAEINFWKNNCPIKLLEEKLIENGYLSDDDKISFCADIHAEIDDAFNYAKKSPFPEEPTWSELNYCNINFRHQYLLNESDVSQFDQNQEYAIPKPY